MSVHPPPAAPLLDSRDLDGKGDRGRLLPESLIFYIAAPAGILLGIVPGYGKPRLRLVHAWT